MVPAMKSQLAIFISVMGVSAAVPFAIWHRGQVRWADQEAAQRQRTELLEKLTAEKQRLSNLVAQTRYSRALSKGEFEELLKLRGEFLPMQHAAAEADRLRTENEGLEAARAKARKESLPDPSRVQAFWQKDQLAPAGYADPISALETTLWAMSHGDTNALWASVTKKASDKLTRLGWNNRRSPSVELSNTTWIIEESLRPSKGFYVVGQQDPSPDWAILDVYFAGEGKTRKVCMKKVDASWKFSVLGQAGGGDSGLTNGYGMWP